MTERLRGLNKLSPSQLLSVRELLDVDQLAAEFADDAQFVRQVEEQLQYLTGSFGSKLTLSEKRI